MKVYCLFSTYTDGYTYDNKHLVGIFDNEELAYTVLIKYEDKTKKI